MFDTEFEVVSALNVMKYNNCHYVLCKVHDENKFYVRAVCINYNDAVIISDNLLDDSIKNVIVTRIGYSLYLKNGAGRVLNNVDLVNCFT